MTQFKQSWILHVSIDIRDYQSPLLFTSVIRPNYMNLQFVCTSGRNPYSPQKSIANSNVILENRIWKTKVGVQL